MTQDDRELIKKLQDAIQFENYEEVLSELDMNEWEIIEELLGIIEETNIK